MSKRVGICQTKKAKGVGVPVLRGVFGIHVEVKVFGRVRFVVVNSEGKEVINETKDDRGLRMKILRVLEEIQERNGIKKGDMIQVESQRYFDTRNGIE